MTEFEMWQKKALKHEYSPNVYRGAEKGWKAALEYAENLFVKFNSFEVEETINKELRSATS